MSYFNRLIRQSSLKIKNTPDKGIMPVMQPVSQSVEDISVHKEIVASSPISNQEVPERVSEVIRDNRMEFSPSRGKQGLEKKDLSAPNQEPPSKQLLKPATNKQKEAVNDSQEYSEEQSDRKEARSFLSKDNVTQIERTEIKDCSQPTTKRDQAVNKVGLTNNNETHQYIDRHSTIKKPVEEREKKSAQPADDEHHNYEDKNLMSNYVFEQVRNWVSGDDQHLEPETISMLPNTKDPIKYPKQSTPIPVQQQTINTNYHHHHVEQQLVKSLEQDVQLSIGMINVVVEAPQKTQVTQAPQATGQSKKRESAAVFFNWQRHYFNY